MSYSLQSRNVLFCPGGEMVRVILAVPVKRRRAMLASNPIRGIAGRNSSWTVGRGPSVASLDWGSGADQREAASNAPKQRNRRRVTLLPAYVKKHGDSYPRCVPDGLVPQSVALGRVGEMPVPVPKGEDLTVTRIS